MDLMIIYIYIHIHINVSEIDGKLQFSIMYLKKSGINVENMDYIDC